MNNKFAYSVQVHNIGYDVGCAFLLHPINIHSGEVDYTKLQSAIMFDVSGNIEKAVSCYAAGYDFNWGDISEYPEDKVKAVVLKKLDALLSLLVYNNRIDIDLDVSDSYLLINKHNRIILTTEPLMLENIGYVAKPIISDYEFPYGNPELVRKTSLFNDHVEFNILVHHLIESDTQGNEIGKHIFATFEPVDFHDSLRTHSFEFLCAHEQRNQPELTFDTRLHYDFFNQSWQPVKGISPNGVMPNGNKMHYQHADFF